MSLRELYQEIIIDHGKLPRNFGSLDQANHHQLGHNPLCGDRLMLHALIENDKIQDLKFEGAGCAISMASASLMTESLKGKTIEQAMDLFKHFHELVTLGKEAEIDMGKLAVFAGVAEFPARVKCASLAWHTLQAILHNKQDPVSTE